MDGGGCAVRQRQGERGGLAGLVTQELAADAAIAHDDEAVGDAQHLGQLAGDDDDAAARRGHVVDDLVDLVLGAHVDAARRLVEDEHLQARLGQPARQDDLLLVAAGQQADLLLTVRGLDAQLLDEVVGALRLLAVAQEHAGGEAVAAAADVDVLSHRRVRQDALLLAVLRAQHDAGGDGVGRCVGPHGLAVQPHLAAAARVGAVQQPHQLAATGAHQAEEAQHLATTHGEAQRLGELHAVQAARLQADGALGAGAVVVDVLHLAAHHVADEAVPRHVGHLVMRDDLAAVAEDGAGVAQLVQLFEAVRDVDQRAALGTQALDEAEQDLRLAVRQAAGGLVEGDDLGVLHDGLADLHHLALRDGQVRQARRRVQVHADVGQLLGHPLAGGLVVHQAEARGQAAQQHVLGHGQLGHVLQLLVDDGHAGGDGVAGRCEVALLAVDDEPPAVGLVLAAEDLQQRALARAVLAQQAHDLARAGLEAHPVQRLDAGEELADVVELQRRHHKPICLRISAWLARVISTPLVNVTAGGVLPWVAHSKTAVDVS